MKFRSYLLRAGFEWLQPPARQLPERFRAHKGTKFVKRYVTHLGDFKVLLIRTQQDLTKLPLTFILEKPVQFKEVALPHISNNGFLCFADNDQSQWNPLDGASFAAAIDNSITKTLNVAVDNYANPEEYRNEFSNYWEGHCRAFSFEALPTENKIIKYCSLKVKTGRDVEETTEFVVYTEPDERRRWLELRGENSTSEDASAIVVTVKRNNWAPTTVWPPLSFADVIDWLAKADRSAHDNLIFQLVKLSAKRTVVILQIIGEGQIGFKLTFSSQYQKLFQSWSHRKKRSVRSMIAPIRSSKAVEFFARLSIEVIDRNAVFLRNRPKPEIGDIRNKRIALIGCGTIGGYVAEYLVKAGAGVGSEGSLTLYDSDRLSIGNLGRHRLPASFVDWNKADGLAKLIEDDALHPVSVYVKKEDFEIFPENLKEYDVVVDATGRVPVSLALAGAVREIKSNPPTIIHGLNHRWGQESIAFIDNGKACYGCLDKLVNAEVGQPDFDTSRYSCGSTYTPYDANVSVISAALVVEAVLNTLEPKHKWTYTKITSEKTKSQKRLILEPWTDCKVCGRGKVR
ncbi:ThiF family adenylyltransferase [Enterovibrio sp. FF113]|uniref:ThiF family adenylyltransferase n=1 Tax=Enterovibrio sp. FF113 TaxID=3230010 RepID=UPI00352F3C6F